MMTRALVELDSERLPVLFGKGPERSLTNNKKVAPESVIPPKSYNIYIYIYIT